MSLKFIVLCSALAVARAGYLAPAAPAVATSYSTFSAAPALRYAAAAPTVGYGGYGYHGGYAAPAVHAAPAVAYSSAPAVSTVSYSSPVVSYGAPIAAGAITSDSTNILRSFGNLGTVATHSKTIDTPFSSVTKSDVRVSNPGFAVAAPAVAAVAPAVAPAVHTSYHGNAFGYAAAPAIAHTGYGYHGGYGYHAAPAAYGYGYSAAPLAYGRSYSAGYGLGYAGYGHGYSGYGHAGYGYAAAAPVARVSYTGTYGSYGW